MEYHGTILLCYSHQPFNNSGHILPKKKEKTLGVRKKESEIIFVHTNLTTKAKRE